MNTEYRDFIGTYTGVYPAGFCSGLVEEFELKTSTGAGTTRQNGEGAKKHAKDDLQLCLNAKHDPTSRFNGDSFSDVFFKGLQACYEDYAEEY